MSACACGFKFCILNKIVFKFVAIEQMVTKHLAILANNNISARSIGSSVPCLRGQHAQGAFRKQLLKFILIKWMSLGQIVAHWIFANVLQDWQETSAAFPM